MNEQPPKLPKLSAKERSSFTQLLKIGIYKELHHKKLINSGQLNALISQETKTV